MDLMRPELKFRESKMHFMTGHALFFENALLH
jgi:hypothetical protein